MIIIVTGTPGTGKTTVSKWLSQKLKIPYLNVKKLIVKNKLYEKYDKKTSSYIVDTKLLNNKIVKEIRNRKDIIIDSHLSHFISNKEVDLCIVCTCELKKLNKRLEKRKYNQKKIRENLDAEIFNICLEESKQEGHKTLLVETSIPWKNKLYSDIIKIR